MSGDTPFRPDLKNKAKNSFQRTTLEIYRKAQGLPDAIAALRNISVRTDSTKNRLRQHFKRHEETWVAREAIKVWKKRAAPRLNMPAPINIMSNKLATDQIMKQARLNVRRRMAGRLTRINQVKTRMENSVVRSQKFARDNRDLRLGRAFEKAQTPKRKMKRSL